MMKSLILVSFVLSLSGCATKTCVIPPIPDFPTPPSMLMEPAGKLMPLRQEIPKK